MFIYILFYLILKSKYDLEMKVTVDVKKKFV